MKSVFIILAVLALVHIARPETAGAVDQTVEHAKPQSTDVKPEEGAQAVQAVAVQPPTQTTCGSGLQLGDWECADKTSWRMCDHGGKWFEGKCDDGAECMLLPNDKKKVQCFKFIHYPYPTGPNGEVHQPDLKPATGGDHPRRRRSDDSHAEQAGKPQSTDVKPEEGAQAVQAVAAQPPTQTTCGSGLQLGEWECADKTGWRMCDHGGKWFEGKCDDGAECMLLPNDKKKVQCFKFIHYPYPTGPNGEVHQPDLKPAAGSTLLRQRRSDDSHAEQAGKPQSTDVKPEEGAQAVQAVAAQPPTQTTCGSGLQLGDWECADKTGWRMCDHGGKWFEGKCDDGSECMLLPNDKKKVQCFKFIHYPYPTGPNGEVHQPELKPAAGEHEVSQPIKTGSRLLRFRRSAN